MGHQDIIDEDFFQKDIWVIDDKKLIEILRDHTYTPIINVLSKNPSTIKELTEKYNEIVKNEALKLCIPKEVFDKMKRSEKSIYRYIQDLIDEGLVALAGRRVLIERTASENLYARTAKVFLIKEEGEGWWRSEEAKPFIDKVALLFSIVFDKTIVSKENLRDLLNEIERNKLREFFDVLEEKYEKISNILLEGSIEENNKILGVLGSLIAIFNSESYRKQLENCFEK